MKTIIPFNNINDFRHMDAVLNRMFGENPTPSSTLTVPVDVYEANGNVVIKALVPGVNPEDLEITIEKSILTIRGEAKGEELPEGTKTYRSENVYGTFSRSLRLGNQLNTEAVDASFKNGFVTITIPKVEIEKPQPLRIPVRTEV